MAESSPTGFKKELITQKYSDLKAEHLEWLWAGKIPNIGVSLFDGDPETGKTTTTIYVAAKVSKGGLFPNCKKPTKQGSVLIISGEDSHPAIVKPRLMAAGADLDKVERIVTVRTTIGTASKDESLVDLMAIMDVLEEKIKTMPDFRLLILDTLTSYLGGRKINDTGEMKAYLDSLSEMSYRLGFAVIVIHHFNKNEDAAAAYRSLGATGIRAAVRGEWGFVQDKHDSERFLMLCGKASWGKKDTGLAFRIEGKEISIDDKPTWPGYCKFEDGVIQETLKDVLGQNQKKGSPKKDEAIELLRDHLRDGQEHNSLDVIAVAEQHGISERTLRKAMKDAGVKTTGIRNPDTGRYDSWLWRI